MARGNSGRIVIEIDPESKHELYASLAREGKTLKAWFLGNARRYVAEQREPYLFSADPQGDGANETARTTR